MQVPVDYPLDDAARTAQFSIDELMYAVHLDRMSDPSTTESQHTPLQERLRFNVEPNEPTTQTPVPQPLAAIAQTLLAGERAHAAASAFSRLKRINR